MWTPLKGRTFRCAIVNPLFLSFRGASGPEESAVSLQRDDFFSSLDSRSWIVGGAFFDGSILFIMRRSVTERVGIHLAGNVRRRVPANGNHLGHDGNRDLFGRDRSDLETHGCVYVSEFVGRNPF